MTDIEIRQEVNKVFQEGFEIEPSKLTPDAHLFQTLKLDSLDAVDLMVHLEERLGLKVSEEAFQKVRTLDDVYKAVGTLVQEQKQKGQA